MKNTIFLLLFIVIVMSCVPPTRFKALQTESLTCQEENDQLKADNERLSVEIKEIKAQIALVEKTLAKAKNDTMRWKEATSKLSRQNSQLINDNHDLQEAQQALLKGSEGDIQRLMDELQVAQNDLQKRETDLNKLSADINARQADLNRMQTELNERNIRLAELEKILQEQESVLTTLRRKVSGALLGFENQGLTVTQKNGRVYVSLDEKLLFKSGSTVVDPKGVSALKTLSNVLEQNPDINIMIEGHTDDVPVIAGSTYKDNWDLSALRATSIVRILLEGSTINPQRLTTAGRSQYQPVDAGKTAEARQKNRRTEIILSPKLDTLYKLLNEK